MLDTMWLGLMPATIAQLMYSNIRDISRTFVDRDEGILWRKNLTHDWKQIENFNMGRAIGIHRIMNGVGTDHEAKLIDKHGLQQKQKEINSKKKSKAKRSLAHLQQESNEGQSKKSKKEINTKPVQETTCNGITCGLEKVRWCGTSIFCPNSIPINRKQCLRCSLFTTAMKTTANMLIHLQRIPSNNQIKMIQLLQIQKQKRNINFNSLIHMLKTFIPSNAQFQRAQYINKKRPTEKWERICKLLIELATRNTNPILNTNNAGTAIEKWINEIEQTIAMKNTELKHNKIFMDKCLKEFQSDLKSIKAATKENHVNNERKADNRGHVLEAKIKLTVIPAQRLENTSPTNENTIIDILSDEEPNTEQGAIIHINCEDDTGKCMIEKGDSSTAATEPSNIEKEALLRAKINLLNRRMYTAGSTMLMAIEVIRHTYKEGNVYVACPEAAQIISSWTPNEGWCRFARIFYSNQVCHRKPDGLYIIPIFSGETTSGHWSVIAIQKTRREQMAVILDSLGRGSLNTPIVKLISHAFKPHRGRRMEWKNPECRNQTGVECGARTINAMSCLAKAFHEKVEFDENIRRATLWTPSEYNQMGIRRSAANLVQTYRDCMKSRAIRLRQWR